jgi:hypothetical protein
MIFRPLNLPELGLLIFLAARLSRRGASIAGAAHDGSGGTERWRQREPTIHQPHAQPPAGRKNSRHPKFLDEDGVLVLVALYLDQEGEL